jgi:PAS domain S-box-containing protein
MRGRPETPSSRQVPQGAVLSSPVRVLLAAAQVSLALGILTADLWLPNSYSVANAYPLVILIGLRRGPRWVTLTFVGCALLLFAGWWFSADPMPALVVSVNRGLTAGILCVTAALVWRVEIVRMQLRARLADSVRNSELLERADERFRLALDSSTHSMILVDGTGRIVRVNALAEEVFGYAAEDLCGCAVEILVPERFRSKHGELRTLFLRAPSTRPMAVGRELFAVRKDGSEFPVEIILNLLETSDGTLVLAAIVDISARKRAEEEMHQMVEALPSGILVVDAKGTIVLANSLLNGLFRYAKDELIGKPIETLVPPRHVTGHPEKVSSFFAAPVPTFLGAGRTLYGMRKDGQEFPVEIGLNPIQTQYGPRVIAAVVDISARLRTQKELELAAEDLRRSNEELDAFAYIASHDLKAPLRAIESLSKWIEEDAAPVLPPKSRQHLETLTARVQRMRTLLDDLLEYSRAGRAEEGVADIDVRTLVQDVLDTLGPNPSFSVDILGELPSVRCSRSPLAQVFRNLIDNAIKHHDRPGGRVQIGGRPVGRDLAEFRVTDDGPGIPAEFRERVFRMFQTLKPRDEVEGSGMGLALVRKVVHRNGGTIRVENRSSQGSEFIFTWRRVPAREEVA